MKLRLLKRKKSICIFCQNGTILNPSQEDLIRLLTAFSKPQTFKGNDGYWNTAFPNMEDADGETLAYIDDANKLIVLNENTFSKIIRKEEKYISASEYAVLHGKCRATVKNLCVAGKLPGAYKTSSGWLIPENTPYPEDGRTKKVKDCTKKP